MTPNAALNALLSKVDLQSCPVVFTCNTLVPYLVKGVHLSVETAAVFLPYCLDATGDFLHRLCLLISLQYIPLSLAIGTSSLSGSAIFFLF